MKRLILFFFAVALFSSCVEETLPVDSTTAESAPAFSAVRENFATPGKDTKTILRYDRSVEWTKGDGVGLFDGTSIQRSDYTIPTKLVDDGWCISYKYVAATNGSETSFSYLYYGKDAEEHKSHIPAVGKEYFLLYPWNTNFLANPSKGEFRCWIKKEQTAEAGTYDASRGFAVARTTDLSQPVTFRNAVSLLEFVITPEMDSKIVSIAVKGNNSEALGGNILVKLADDGTVTTSAWNENAEYKEMHSAGFETVITFKGPDTGLAAGKYYLSVMPNTLSKGITVTATDINGSTYVRTSSASFTFKPSMIYGMGEIEGGTYTTEGITELPYVFSLYATADEGNTAKYMSASVVSAYDATTKYFENKYTDLTQPGAVFYVRGAGSKSGDIRASLYYSNVYGPDNIPAKSFVSKESAGSNYVESYYKLSVPLNMTLPSKINVTFGLALWGSAIRDWKLQYSKDGATWSDGGTFSNPTTTAAAYYIFNVSCELAESFGPGDILHLKWIPYGNTSVKNATTTGWGSDCRFWGGVVISDPSQSTSSSPINSDVVYYESFDRMTGGVDYFMGGQMNGTEKLGHLSNSMGAVIADWTDAQANGLTGANVAMRPGYVQVGYVKPNTRFDNSTLNAVTGNLVTPKLTAGNLDLSFKASAFRSPLIRPDDKNAYGDRKDYAGDATTIIVEVLNGGTIDGATSKTIENVPTNAFKTFNLTIMNATDETQVKFTSPSVTDRYTRWFLDDICVTRSGETADQIKVMSFNVNNSLTEDSGLMDTDPKRWTVRRHAINEMLKVEKPAVVGGQEVTSVQLSDIAGFGYGAYGIGRTDGGVTEESGEMMGIFYDQSQVTLEENGTFWLNEDGTVGEKGWDAGYVRIASWARFSLRGKPYKKFIVLNTHLDNTGAESRKQSIIKIKNKLKEINPNGLPVVLLGDFNIVATDRIFDVLKPDFVDTRAVAPETDTEPTYTKWGEKDFAGRIIDHVFASGFDILKYRTVNDRTYRGKGTFLGFPFDETCPYLSDHDPVTATLEF